MSLDALSDSRGRFSILAIDHRDSLRRFLRPGDPGSLTAAEITALKIELVAGVADMASGVMLEPEYSIPQVLDAGVLPSGVGFLAALEAQGYLDDPGAGPTSILDGWSIEQARESGAAACKLLLPYHPDRPLAAAQERVAVEVLDGCRRAGIPLVLEPLFYDLDSPADRPRVVVETARRFARLGPDLLKLPHPGSADACDDVTAEAERSGPDGPIPWAMLSGGGTFGAFAEQFADAAARGCSGFMVGRALWGEWAAADAADRPRLLAEVVRPRFAELVAITVNT